MRMFILFYGCNFLVYPLSGAEQTTSLEQFLSTVEQSHPFFEQESLSVTISVEYQSDYLGDKDRMIESSPLDVMTRKDTT